MGAAERTGRYYVSCFADRASRYNAGQMTNLMHNCVI